MRPRATLLIALVVSLASAASARAFETYTVIGVQPGDALVIREEPGEGRPVSELKELGRIPAGSGNVLGTGRAIAVGEQRWYEVSFGGTKGWVNSTFLESAEMADLKDATFACSGTEPFWGVTLSSKGGKYTDPESETVLTTKAVQPAAARLFPLLYQLTDGAGKSYRATVSRQTWCTDGMSDYEYAFEVLFNSIETFHQGCCVIER
ncbi:MAG: hypothetical protein NW216_08805 [Hyphomicrobium sp.]|nr:hypothetical protein [Hyphomicrobium sp.]